jgi:hypothetical protein
LRDAIDKIRLIIVDLRPGDISELTIPTIVLNGFTVEKILIPDFYFIEGEPYKEGEQSKDDPSLIIR